MNRPIAILCALLLPFCGCGVAWADAPVAQQYPNPTFADSSDNDPSLLGKMLLAMQPANMGPASQVGAAHGANGWIKASADGTSASFLRPTRRRILYTNTSTSEIVYAGFVSGVTGLVGGAPTSTTGQPIPPGGSLAQFSVVPMYFFSADGNAWVSWIEAYD